MSKLTDIGQVSVVTGASAGVGRAVALGLASLGSDVICVDSDGEGLTGTSEAVEALGVRARAVQADIRNGLDVSRVTEVASQLGNSVDVLVNCAGITRQWPAEEFPEDDWDAVIDVNLKGTFLCCQAIGKLMIEGGGGSIVNFASIGGVVGYPGTIAYLASKGGVVQLTRGLAVEWAPYGVNVNAVAPSVVMTPMQERLRESNPERFDRFLANTPLNRAAELDEIVDSVVYLCSDAAKFVTGHILAVDGGYLSQ